MKSNSKENKFRVKNSAWVGYISPFTLIVPDGEEPLKTELNQINSNSYNHGALCRIVKTYHFCNSTDLPLLICYDGAIAVPRVSIYEDKEATVDYFNKLFSYITIAGLYCEAVDQRDIVSGELFESRAIWPVNFGESASSHFHSKLRMKLGGNFDSIILSNPKHIFISDLMSMIELGRNTLNQIPNLTPTFLIRGITELKYRNWSTALSNLWITIEQLTDYLWLNYFLERDSTVKAKLPSRFRAMKEDNRTWNTTVKQELLYQKGIISEEEFALIFPARQERNKLVHEGKSISESTANNIFDAVVSLLSIATNNPNLPLKNVLGKKRKAELSETVRKASVDYSEWSVLKIN